MVEAVNADQKRVIAGKVTKRFGADLSAYTFALWGLSFKPETDDMRESPAITVVEELTRRGAKIKAYDPKAVREAEAFYLKGNTSVSYGKSKYEVLSGCDALILITEWKEFRSPDFEEIKKLLKRAVLFDGRNQYSREKLEGLGFEYYQIGVRDKTAG